MNTLLDLTRRQFFGSSGLRLGGAAMALLARRAAAAERVHPPLAGFPHFNPPPGPSSAFT